MIGEGVVKVLWRAGVIEGYGIKVFGRDEVKGLGRRVSCGNGERDFIFWERDLLWGIEKINYLDKDRKYIKFVYVINL